jgi:hypothetical protein
MLGGMEVLVRRQDVAMGNGNTVGGFEERCRVCCCPPANWDVSHSVHSVRAGSASCVAAARTVCESSLVTMRGACLALPTHMCGVRPAFPIGIFAGACEKRLSGPCNSTAQHRTEQNRAGRRSD